MNNYVRFLMGCYSAVVKIRPYTSDLYNFVRLMEYLGFKEYIEWFEKSGCDVRSKEEKAEREYIREEDFCEDHFLHLAKINGVQGNEICIELQLDKGFTFGKEEDYRNGEEVAILSVEDLIIATGYESEFMLDGENILLSDIDKKYEELDQFCDFYEWRVQKFGNKYNILDAQTEEFREDKNVDLEEIIEIVYFRMLDYWFDEGLDGYDISDECDVQHLKKMTEKYLELGITLKIMEKDSEQYKQYNNIYEELLKEIEDLKKE